MEIFFGKVSWNLTVFENFQCSDWLILWSHDLKWDFERFQAYLKLLEVMDPYRTLFDSLFESFLISKVSNSTSHLKSHLKVSYKQQMRLEMRCAISALHKANWLPCSVWFHWQGRWSLIYHNVNITRKPVGFMQSWNCTSHFKSHLLLIWNFQMRLEMRCAIWNFWNEMCYLKLLKLETFETRCAIWNFWNPLMGDLKFLVIKFNQFLGCIPPACCPYLPACTASGCEQNSWHTLLKILPCPNFIAGSN